MDKLGQTEKEKIFREFLEEYLANVQKILPETFRARQLVHGGFPAEAVYRFETEFLKEPFMKALEKVERHG